MTCAIHLFFLWLSGLVNNKLCFIVWAIIFKLVNLDVHIHVFAAMVNLTESMCWKAVARGVDRSRIGLVVFQKPVSYSCYEKRRENYPPLCDKKDELNSSWYTFEYIIYCHHIIHTYMSIWSHMHTHTCTELFGQPLI